MFVHLTINKGPENTGLGVDLTAICSNEMLFTKRARGRFKLNASAKSKRVSKSQSSTIDLSILKDSYLI